MSKIYNHSISRKELVQDDQKSYERPIQKHMRHRLPWRQAQAVTRGWSQIITVIERVNKYNKKGKIKWELNAEYHSISQILHKEQQFKSNSLETIKNNNRYSSIANSRRNKEGKLKLWMIELIKSIRNICAINVVLAPQLPNIWLSRVCFNIQLDLVRSLKWGANLEAGGADCKRRLLVWFLMIMMEWGHRALHFLAGPN